MAKEDAQRDLRSFLLSREPSIDRRYRPRPEEKKELFTNIDENLNSDNSKQTEDGNENTLNSFKTCNYNDDDSCSTCSNSESSILVYLRLRPVKSASTLYSISDERNALIVGSNSKLANNNANANANKNYTEKQYRFTAVFDYHISQEEVYERCIGENVLMDGNLVVMAYGTSGSGKTYTLLGDNHRPGIIPRVLQNIFNYYAYNIHQTPSIKLIDTHITILDDDAVAKENDLRYQLLNSCSEFDVQQSDLPQKNVQDTFKRYSENAIIHIWITFVEIYNEIVYDLLSGITKTWEKNPNGNKNRKKLKVVCSDGKVFIKDVTSIYVKNQAEAMQLLFSGLQNLTYASTSINVHSSRSHCIFYLDVLKYYRTGLMEVNSYKFCDLAGSERLQKTGNIGSRLKEAQSINTSLMILGRCLDAVKNAAGVKRERIPYRESKLTMLLQASLQGKEKLTMLVNVTPTENYYEENLNVLNFASIARSITLKPQIVTKYYSRCSTLIDSCADNLKDEYIKQLLDENLHLSNELKRLVEKHNDDLEEQEHKLRNNLVDSFQAMLTENKKLYEERLSQRLNDQKRIYECQIKAMKQKYEDEIEELEEELQNIKESKTPDVSEV